MADCYGSDFVWHGAEPTPETVPCKDKADWAIWSSALPAWYACHSHLASTIVVLSDLNPGDELRLKRI